MNQAAEAFYAARDARTMQYGAATDALSRPVIVVVGWDVADTRPGQVAALALVNMISRSHRTLTVITKPAPLQAHAIVAGSTLSEAMSSTAYAINPFIEFTVTSHITAVKLAGAITIGLGVNAPASLDAYLGWQGGRADIGLTPLAGGGERGDVLGAATAACLGASALFHLTHGRAVEAVALNLVEREAGRSVSTRTLTGPVDVGDVLAIGAGAVTHGLLYWLAELDVVGEWDVIDGDDAELHNTNRCMGMTAADAGWTAGSPGGTVANKARIAARLIGARAHAQWYADWIAGDSAQSRHDLVLVLANEGGVRPAVASRGEALLLHATTSPNWSAELHRHRADVDDCPACRIPDTGASAAFRCSTGPAAPTQESGDAALPFLSAAAGLMLAIALLELPSRDVLLTGRINHWRICFEQRIYLQHSIHPIGDCPHVLPATVRFDVRRTDPRRWDHLDSESLPVPQGDGSAGTDARH